MPIIIPRLHSAIRVHYIPYTTLFNIILIKIARSPKSSNQTTVCTSHCRHEHYTLWQGHFISLLLFVVQRSSTECGVSECNGGTSTVEGLNQLGLSSPPPPPPKKNIYIFIENTLLRSWLCTFLLSLITLLLRKSQNTCLSQILFSDTPPIIRRHFCSKWTAWRFGDSFSSTSCLNCPSRGHRVQASHFEPLLRHPELRLFL